jgi:hypothetical protein
VVKSQAQRFGEIVKRICRKYENIIVGDFGVKIKDIGVHSWQKCAHTKLNTGLTAGPSGPAACIRAIYATVPDKTPAGRPRIISKMKWGTIVKFMYKARAMSVVPGS